jgi:uncharacterized RmlC-like cupin family protein
MIWAANSKIYLPSSGAAALDPGFGATWGRTVTGAVHGLKMNMTGAAGATANVNLEGTLSGFLDEYGFVGWVSAYRLAAQTFPTIGTLDSARMMRTTVTGSTYVAVAVRTVDAAGVQTGSLLAATTTSNLINSSTYENEVRLGTTLADSITCGEGDYLVVEFGADAANTGSKTVGLKYGDGNGADLDTTEGDTIVANPWVAFDFDIEFLDDAGANQLMMVGVGV